MLSIFFCLKEVVIRPLLSLDAKHLSNFWPVSNLPFLGKVFEQVVTAGRTPVIPGGHGLSLE